MKLLGLGEDGPASARTNMEGEEKLNLKEFIRFMSKEIHGHEVAEELAECYRKFSGHDDLTQGITIDQMKDTMSDYGERGHTKAEFALLFKETDTDGDGVINFDEFVKMMMSR